MMLQVPITGKLIGYESLDVNPPILTPVGSNDNPIRPLNFEKLCPGCDFKWAAVAYDYKNGTALVEIVFTKNVTVIEWDKTKKPPEALAWRRESDAQFFKRQAATEKLLQDTFGKPFGELYKLSGESKLEMPV